MLVAGPGHPSNPPGRRGHGLVGGAPSGSLRGRGRAGRRQKPSIGKFTLSKRYVGVYPEQKAPGEEVTRCNHR